jgi:hypothetical protein
MRPDVPPLRLRANGLAWRLVRNEVIALDSRSSTYFATRGSGAIIWEALARGASRAELVECLVGRYGIDEQAAAADVDRFVADLGGRGLLADDGASAA